MYRFTLLSALLAAAVGATPLELDARDTTCSSGFTVCSPNGAKSNTSPKVGSDMSAFYTSLLSSTNGIHFSSRSTLEMTLDVRASGPSMCCASGTNCVNLQNYNIPFCYDKFTTNYVLPDGSTGNINSGAYDGADGSKANLLTGNYTSGGQSGNIYGNAANAPNTATLSIPPQFTGTGVGSAIPLTALASIVVYTTVIPPSVIQPTTIAASTMPGTTISGTVVSGTVVSGSTAAPSTVAPSTVQPSTVQATTITAPTTVAAITTVVTSQVPAGTAAASTSKTGAATAVRPDDKTWAASACVMLLGGMILAFYAL